MTGSKILGLNHITLAVSDLGRSIRFYCDVLGCDLRAEWDEGAYLEAGPLWLCLSKDAQARTVPHPDCSHIAFSVNSTDFNELSRRVCSKASIWKGNRSEGDSLYFLDPDGHKLELHVGSLTSRLAHYRSDPASEVKIF